MRRFVNAGWLAGLLLLLGTARGAEGTGPLTPGKDVPGPFHPYNATGERKGYYHCQVSRAGFDPCVMLVKRGLDDPNFRLLLDQLDKLIEANPRSRLHAFAVFQVDDLPRPIGDDEKLLPLAARLDDLARGLRLKHVVLTVAGKDDLARYALPADAGLTAILFRRARIDTSEVLPGEEVDQARIRDILARVAKMMSKKD